MSEACDADHQESQTCEQTVRSRLMGLLSLSRAKTSVNSEHSREPF